MLLLSALAGLLLPGPLGREGAELPARAIARLGTTSFAHAMAISSVSWSDQTPVLVTASGSDRSIRLWEVPGGRQIGAVETGGVGCLHARLVDSGKTVLACGSTGYACWDLASGKQLFVERLARTRIVTAAMVSRDSEWICLGDKKGRIVLKALKQNKDVGKPMDHGVQISAIAISPDRRLIAAGGTDGTITLWDANTGTRLATTTHHKYGVVALVFSPNGKILASAGGDPNVRIWETAKLSQMRVLECGDRDVTAMAVTDDGQVLATGNAFGLIRISDFATGQKVHDLRAARCAVATLAFFEGWQDAGLCGGA